MEFRRLGSSGFKVPALSLGTGTFGGKGMLQGLGRDRTSRRRDAWSTSASTPGSTCSTAPTSIPTGAAEEVLGGAIKGRRDDVLISTKATFRIGEGPNDVGSSRYHLIQAVEGSLKRLGTDYIDLFQLHGFDALTPVEEVLSHARRLRPRRQDPLHRLLQLLRLAPDEVARRLGPLRLAALCGAPGLLFAHRPRLRVGAHAARRSTRASARSCGARWDGAG